jgi:hypothetical protein
MAQGTILDMMRNMVAQPTVGPEWHRRRPAVDFKDDEGRPARGTIHSISFGDKAGEVLIPTIVNGRKVSNAEAIAHYRRTGEHLGIFRTPEEATDYAKRLSNALGDGIYAGPPQPE